MQEGSARRRVRGTFILDYVPNAWMRCPSRPGSAMNRSGSLHQIDIGALQDAVADNLTRETTDPWASEAVRETGPEAEGKGAQDAWTGNT